SGCFARRLKLTGIATTVLFHVSTTGLSDTPPQAHWHRNDCAPLPSQRPASKAVPGGLRARMKS
ncbi:MAG: hypothetical protein ACOYMN_17155, partial [Roseimicrobium sp.]